MSLSQLLRNAAFGLGLALTPVCGGSSSNWPEEGEAEAEAEAEVENGLEVLVEQGTTDSQGTAFTGEQRITVSDRQNNPLPGVDVALYQISGSGDVYLARTAQNEGGMNAFATDDSRRAGTRRFGVNSRELIIRPASGTTLLDRPRQEVIYNLLRWTLGDRYSCDGIYTTEELIEGRERTMRFIAYFDPSGMVQNTYDTVEYAIDVGLLDDLPPGKEWYVLTPENPLAPPTVIQVDLAEDIFGSQTYARLQEACGGEFRCTGKEEFCDDFSGSELDLEKWDERICGGTSYHSLDDGILELHIGDRGACGIDSLSTYTLGNSTFTFEARWKVREREGVVSHVDLANNIEEVGFGFLYGSSGLLCDNTSSSDCSNSYSSCDSPATEYQTLRLAADRNEISYFVNNELKASSSTCITSDVPLNIYFSCGSRDDNEKKCFLDYVQLIRE